MNRKILQALSGTLKGEPRSSIIAATLIIIPAAALFYWLSYVYILEEAEDNITNLLLSHKGIHHYVQNTLIQAYEKYQIDGKIPATFYAPELLSSSYIVRKQHIFYNQERKEAGLNELYYKLAANNPRNPVNRADHLESDLISMFNQNRDIKSYRKIIEINGEKNLYVAIPFLENQKRCMRCHGKREDAPIELQQSYPGEGGFNETTGEIRAITSIRSPMEHEYIHIYVIGLTILVSVITFGALFFFNAQLRIVVQRKTVSLKEEIEERKHAEEKRIELEKQLRQAHKMESIGTLASGIAHDFNNILTIILGYAELASEEKDPDNLIQDLEEIKKGGERAKELVKQILEFSRKTEYSYQPILLSPIIKETLKMLRASIPATIDIKQQINSSGRVLADPTQIHQIMMNLCINAYHAMRETGGTLHVSASDIELSREDSGSGVPPGKYLKIEVSDTGCGITEEIKDRIFDPYFTTKETGEGTGLGLAVVHGIIKNSNGHISVYSESGQGTSFHIYLPLVEQKAATLQGDSIVNSIAGSGERILIVDDEVQITEIIRRYLSAEGYCIATYTNSGEALEEFQKDPDQFDLIITDMTMPYMTGAELSQRLLSIRPDIPIILCTGQSEIIDRKKAYAMGIAIYLKKPVSKQDLVAAVRKALKRGESNNVMFKVSDSSAELN